MSPTSFQLDDTIAALASAPGPAGRGIVRLSGPRALNCLANWFEPADAERWKRAEGAACHAGGLQLDGLRSALAAKVYAWPNVRSYTGQPLVEIHAPGSPPLLEAILGRVFEAGARPAHPGEFTLRAFLAGRIDLVQAEAVLGVIDAGGGDALGVALRQLAGGISGRMSQMQSDLIDLLADLEAGLDFVEDGIEFVSREDLIQRIRRSEATVEELLRQCQGRSQSAGLRRIVLAGLPNAGKSTLFNALLSRDAALVSSRAGTTRDYLSGTLQWHSVAVELIDTPGWEADTPNGRGDNANAGVDEDLTRQSQELGARQRQQADLILWCSSVGVNESERLEDGRIRMREIEGSRPLLIVGTKCDLIEPSPPGRSDSQTLLVSAKTGKGLANLVERCASMLAGSASDGTEILGTTAARCRESLAHCREALASAAGAAESSLGDEIVALELRESLEQLGRVLGTVYADDILGRIFSRFCIGK